MDIRRRAFYHGREYRRSDLATMRTRSPEAPDRQPALAPAGPWRARPLAHGSARLTTPAAVALLLGGLLRLALAWRDISVLDTLFFPDDTYLSLGIARNIALGLGSTFD